MIVKSLRDLDKYIDTIKQKNILSNNVEMVFRGQANEKWLLYPQISRSYFKSILSKNFEYKIIYDFNKLIKKYKLNDFLQYNRMNSWESYFEFQHLGLPTRLMDWSNNLYTALFFSIEDPKYDDTDGVIWIFHLTDKYLFGEDKKHLYIYKNPLNIRTSMLINPAIVYTSRYNDFIGIRRKLIQNGKFLLQPRSLTLTPLENSKLFKFQLEKILVPAILKKQFRNELEDREINKENVYCIEKENSRNSILFNLINKKIKLKYGFTKKCCRILRRQL
jgi:hypothetical protein